MAKHCRTCRRSKLLADFTVNNDRADGYSPDCRACQKAKRQGAVAPASKTNVKTWVRDKNWLY